MANVNCKYTYYPIASGEPIKNSSQCAETPATYIHVPQAAAVEELQFCGTTISINCTLRNPPPGGVEITKAVIDFNYEMNCKGRVGFGTNYLESTEFPARNINGSTFGSYEYEITGLTNKTSQTFQITFWPYAINGTIIISYVDVRIYYRSLTIDTSIPAPVEIEVWPQYYNRVAVRWSPPENFTGTIDHYSVGVFAGPNDKTLLTPNSGELVSLGWIDTERTNQTSMIVPLTSFLGTKNYNEINTTPSLYVKVCAVLDSKIVGAAGCSLDTSNEFYRSASFVFIDTLEDENETMFEIDDLMTAYTLCRQFIGHVNRLTQESAQMAAIMPAINTLDWDYDIPITQNHYDILMHQLQGRNENYEIPDNIDEVETPITHTQWALLLEKL